MWSRLTRRSRRRRAAAADDIYDRYSPPPTDDDNAARSPNDDPSLVRGSPFPVASPPLTGYYGSVSVARSPSTGYSGPLGREAVPPHMPVVPQQNVFERPLKVSEFGSASHEELFGDINAPPTRVLKPVPSPQRHCRSCGSISLAALLGGQWSVTYRRFLDLECSASTCSLCAMFYNACLVSGPYAPDAERRCQVSTRTSWTELLQPEKSESMVPIFECDDPHRDGYNTRAERIANEPGKVMVFGYSLRLHASPGKKICRTHCYHLD